MRSIRNGLEGAGIPVENSKGEWEPGQEEINVRYTDALQMADRHAILKNACKEIAYQNGKAITFMAKWNTELAGSSAHIHQSLWDLTGKQPLFLDKDTEHGMSELMQNYMAGQLAYAREITWFLAPYINSYKRYQAGTFAPTKAIWSVDNRTAGFRLCGELSNAIRVECRIGGASTAARSSGACCEQAVKESEATPIAKKVMRIGFICSPALFNLCTDYSRRI